MKLVSVLKSTMSGKLFHTVTLAGRIVMLTQYTQFKDNIYISFIQKSTKQNYKTILEARCTSRRLETMSNCQIIIHTMQTSYYDNQPKINHNGSNTQWHNIVTSPTILPSPTRLVSPLSVPSGQRGWLSFHQRWRSLPSILHCPPTSSIPSRFFRPPVHADLPRCPLWDISASLAHRLYIVRQSRRQWKVASHPWRRVVWSPSFDTVCLTRHLQARRHPPASLTAVDCSPPPWHRHYQFVH